MNTTFQDENGRTLQVHVYEHGVVDLVFTHPKGGKYIGSEGWCGDVTVKLSPAQAAAMASLIRPRFISKKRVR